MIVENEEQLESYKPIPKGGAKLLVVLMFATLCCAIHILAFIWIQNNIPEVDQFEWGMGHAVLVSVTFALVIWAALIIMGQKPVAWLREYFKRNVRGRRIWYRLDEEDKVVREIGQLSMEKIPPGKISLELYLGGWFKRPRVIEPGICWDATVRVTQHKNPNVVTLIDESGDRVRLSIEDALRILRHSHAPRFLDWPEIVRKLLTDLSGTKQLNRHQSREFNGLKIKRDALLLVLEQIIAQMQDTSRFGKSTEGQRLREYVESQLLYYLPEDDPRRPAREMAVAGREQQEESDEGKEDQGVQEASDA